MKTDTFKVRLEEEKSRLEGELSKVGRRNPSNPSDWEPLPPTEVNVESDPVDIADFSAGYDNNASIVADLETRYNEVLAALERISEGTYGVCTVGKEKIEEARLEADPAATTCVKHKG
jgi:RNA polymerase-binding transcription factor DksA